MKKIIVFGGGAIGSIFAALLSEKFDVLLIGRKLHVEEINKYGLQLSGEVNKKFYVKSATSVSNIEPETIIFLTVKAHETGEAIEGIKDKLKSDTVIVCLQNGLGSEDIVKDLVTNRVIRATTFVSAVFLGPGKVEVRALSKTFISRVDEEIGKIIMDAGMPAELTDNILDEVWEKLVVNCVINGLGSVLRVKNNELQSKYLREIKRDIVSECVAVAKKEGIIISGSIGEDIESFIQSSSNINSTLQDLMRGKSTEIDFINGAIVKLGKKYKVETPVNKMIWSLIKAKESIV
jgi:2-dehydropantoate 2-reductase